MNLRPGGLVTSALQDELLWAAAWLYKATDDRRYLANNADALGGTGWDVKYPGVQILAAMALRQGKAGAHADVLRLLMPRQGWLEQRPANARWRSARLGPAELVAFAKSQVDFILGSNPRAHGWLWRHVPAVLAKELAEQAVRAGGHDNVSVVLVLFRNFWARTPWQGN
ncbi:hypothetical protein HU200_005728 [Digitaria exilis]|uniref:Glycoside hydrolase family 9 domain-containing protein n=1 Tax=Digitaria exilis TaxID=1010633 RepID=A0A835FRH4_9POAL|nr:hypothetical protein HU200_005728 [Digitaria exilis]